MDTPSLKNSPPTPEEVLDQLVEQFGPENDPSLPFVDQKKFAKQLLAVQMLAHAYGPDAPISAFVVGYAAFSRELSSDPERYDTIFDQMKEAWDEIEAGFYAQKAELSS